MANRRMLAKSITNSSAFLMMPMSAQALYMHLNQNADDDGYCEYFGVMRLCGAHPDDLSVLKARTFVVVFDEKVLVLKDWKENNYLRPDRYEPSKYLEVYPTDTAGIPIVNQKSLSGIPKVDPGKDRIGKDRIGYSTQPPQPEASETVTGSKTKKGSMESVTHEVREAVSHQYQVSQKDVDATWEKLQLWCGAKGRTYKDYGLALRSWIRDRIDRGEIHQVRKVQQSPYVDPGKKPELTAVSDEIRTKLASKLAMS